MSKTEFLKNFRNDRGFRMKWMSKGVRVIQNNVIFLKPDGNVDYVAGNHVY